MAQTSCKRTDEYSTVPLKNSAYLYGKCGQGIAIALIKKGHITGEWAEAKPKNCARHIVRKNDTEMKLLAF